MPVAYPVVGSPEAVVAADFNHDGFLDLAASASSDASVLLGNGDGSFQLAPRAAAGNGAWRLAAADFNNDGNADLVTLAINNYEFVDVNVLLGNGDGTLQAPISTLVATGVEYWDTGLAVGDLNGNGNVDVLATLADAPYYVLLEMVTERCHHSRQAKESSATGQLLPTSTRTAFSISSWGGAFAWAMATARSRPTPGADGGRRRLQWRWPPRRCFERAC